MKISLYKIDETISNKELLGALKTHDYFSVASQKYEGVNYELYLCSKDREEIIWLDELSNLFNSSPLNLDYGKIYNGILLIEAPNKKYFACSFGYAYHVLQKLCDHNFGLDFAESELKIDKIDMKSSFFIQSSKIKELLNVKSDTLIMPEGGESIKFVTGTPQNDQIYGKKVECGASIQFSKNFAYRDCDIFKELNQLIESVQISIKTKNKVNSFPRVRYISKKDKFNEIFDDILLETFKNGECTFDINISSFDIIGNQIFVYQNDYSYEMYFSGKKKETCYKVDILNTSEIEKFIYNNKNVINDINSIKVSIIQDGQKIVTKNIKDFIFAEISYNAKKIILDNGLWGEVNTKFLEELESQLKIINDTYVKLNLQNYKVKYKNEDDYVDSIVSKGQHLKLHKKMIKISNTTFELADLYDKNNNELIAVKLGSDNQNFIYSFDQISSAIKCHIHREEYDLSNRLIEFGISQTDVGLIQSAKTYSVLLGFEQVTYKKKINNNTFSLTDIRSLLLKLKIISWAKYMTDSNYSFNIYLI